MARTVAFLDILGFKNLLQQMPLSELAKKYEDAIKQVAILNQRFSAANDVPTYLPSHKAGEPWCFREVFSDSIILIAIDESQESCLKLLLYARLLFISMLTAKLPVRGAIAAGELYHNSSSSVTLGQALTEAYLIEQQQEWAGVCIADSVWNLYPDLLNAAKDPGNALHYYFMEYPVPWKQTPQPAHRILNWRFNTVIEVGSRKLLQDARLHEEPSKFNNVIKYLEHVRASGSVYFGEGAKNPAECPTFWIGSTQPPFKHGDEL